VLALPGRKGESEWRAPLQWLIVALITVYVLYTLVLMDRLRVVHANAILSLRLVYGIIVL